MFHHVVATASAHPTTTLAGDPARGMPHHAIGGSGVAGVAWVGRARFTAATTVRTQTMGAGRMGARCRQVNYLDGLPLPSLIQGIALEYLIPICLCPILFLLAKMQKGKKNGDIVGIFSQALAFMGRGP